MSSSFDRSITIEVTIRTSQPLLLEGLDVWLRLGLVSEAQVRQLCRSLACPLPQPVPATPTPQVKSLDSNQVGIESAQSESNQPPKVPVGMLQSLMTELSVRWLLFLGVFMVVVSSGVLAANQWQKFPAAGQYAVLLGYTLIFWGVSFWAGRQPNLGLTAQTLQIVTLLLVPVNFWAMDSFGLWQYPLEWLTVAIATVALTTVTVLLLRHAPAYPLRGQLQWLPILNILGLSYLHWGWRLPTFPLIAVYLGMVGTSLITFYQTNHRQQQPSPLLHAASGQTQAEPQQPSLNLAAGVVVYALVVLLGRAIFVVYVPVTSLGLAIGICGWLVAWLAQQQPRTSTESPEFPWEMIGGILLLLGWLVSVGTVVPWQATGVSGLGLWFLGSRLQRFWRRADLAALLGIALQSIWLVWRLVPHSVQEQAIATLTQLTGSQNVPWAMLSVALFPYIILVVGLTEWLYRFSKHELASFSEQIALGSGATLTLISLASPTLRSLNLLFSTATLVIVTQRHPTRVTPVYLTHIMGLLTLGSAIEQLLPNLSREVWASILLAVMVAEWGFSLSNRLTWQRSAWHIGLGLAGLSYSLLWFNASSSWLSNAVDYRLWWGVLWLIAPLALTGVASRTAPPRQGRVSWLSVAALGMAQTLTLTLPGTKLIGLGVAGSLMLINTRYLRSSTAAAITVGFGLSFIGWLLWDGVPGVPRLSAPGWFLVGAIALLGLWLTRSWLKRGRHGTLATIYTQATDGWAIALCSFELLMLTLHSFFLYQGLASPGWEYLIAAALTIGAIAYRSWQQPDNWAFYGMAWGLELFTAEALGFAGYSVINLSVANVVLGLITQLLGEWRRRQRLETVPSRWYILPLLYGVLSALLRVGTFTSWTGLCSLAIALIVIGVGRRREKFKPLVYLGLIGVSVSAYELLFYQLQVLGGAEGDKLIAMSALGTGIMYAYRVLSPWLIDYLRLTAEELKVVSHFHWAWSSCLLMAAIVTPIESSRLVGLGTGGFLIRYALFQGRHHPHLKTAETWVYLGLFEVAGIRIYWIYTAIGRFLASEPLIPWKAPLACILAYFLYILPWETWGWPKRPWQRAAYILPLVFLWETRVEIYPVSLLMTAGFYVLLARLTEKIRFTYISVMLVDWALFRWFSDLHLTDALWYVTPVGLSLLYIAQFDPRLKCQEHKATRHNIRLLGTGAICGVAFLFHQETGLQPGIFSLVAIFAGLAFRVRAFLYVGTAIFLLNAFYQLVVLIFRHPFFKWVIGLLVGITFIWIAANFEARRTQLTYLVRNWIAQLQEWE